jgi:hypothetical protein
MNHPRRHFPTCAGIVLTILGLLLGSAPVFGADTGESLWRTVAERSLAGADDVRVLASTNYRTLALDLPGFSRLIERAPMEDTEAARQAPLVLSLPMPDGRFARFRAELSPIMEPTLAARYPEIRTYRAQGIDDPSATARFDVTPSGFHAMVLSPSGSVYIDPYSRRDTAHYVSYFRRDYGRSEATGWRCLFSDDGPSPGLAEQASPEGIRPATPFGTIRRTYQLAMAATGEYTVFHGGTVPLALAAITTAMNRVNGIYERDVAVRMILVANTDDIIYTNGATDPYTNDDGFAMLFENQSNVDAVIGSANYDIGHVFSTGGGGVAALSSPCNGGVKAEGVTGLPSPIGDPFYVDYVSHEMGHQFGAHHPYNGTSGFCGSPGQRFGPTAYEPGSGSTIMAYAGICGAEDLQPNSDDYFHAVSLNEIISFITGAGNSCDAENATGNTPPTANAGANFTIPMGTPFTLTGSGTDANGDSLTYCWEQFDLGNPSPPNTDDGSRPIFRSFDPVSSSLRTFPQLSDILSGIPTFGESLPTTTRPMNFRLTVRDNRAGGGGTEFDLTQVAVRADAGPFTVTAPARSVSPTVTWAAFSTQAVTWNVANTTAAPVSCANAKVSLSTNNGTTFPTVLLASTPNDGSQNIVVPNLATANGRIKVECVGNIFFDISNVLTITGSGAGPAIASMNPNSGPAGGGTATVITGTNFASGGSATIGGSLATGFSVPMSTQVNATTPARPAGTLNDVVVTNPGGAAATLVKGWLADFTDVPQAHPFHDRIEDLFRSGVTAGCGGGNFCPANLVTRAQMAVFLLKGIHGPAYVPPPATGTVFNDVDVGDFAAANIEQLAEEGITSGCGSGNYCPDASVTREQMAVFLLRAKHGAAYMPPAATGDFDDVPVSSPFAKWIEQLAAEGITAGCGGNNYCPTQAVTRGQMAVFLVKTFDLP